MAAEADLLLAIERDPADDLAWLALADCLEEDGEADRAELVRLREWLRFADLNDPGRGQSERRLGELLLAGVRPSVPVRRVPLGPREILTLSLIPPGPFWMGSGQGDPDRRSDELPRHRVRLSLPFWIGTTSVTKGQWQEVLEPQSAAGPRPSHPMQGVLWAECGRFCKALGETRGGNFRLPTEAEWECACRAGVVGVYLGEAGALDHAAWHAGNSRLRAHPVGRKAPNAWGLYDMLGNVWDWCADGERAYLAEEASDPVGPNGPRRMTKGAAWNSPPSRCRPGARYAEEARRRTDDQGFRVVMDWS